MARTIVGVFDTNTAAQQAVDDLMAQGITRDEISVLARGDEQATAVNDTSRAGEDAGFGAATGTALGGALGLLVGIGALAIPGIGPVLAIGPLAAALGSAGAGALIGAGVGAASGGVIGALVGAGIPEEEAGIYAESIRRGGVLVAVTNEVLSETTIHEVLRRNGAADVNNRTASWRSEGWKSFDPNAGEYRRDYDSTTGKIRSDAANTGAEVRRDWEDSSKVGTAAGTVAGAATGAAIGSVAGPVGTVVGGIAGAVTGAGVGAAGDVAGEEADDAMDRPGTTRRTDSNVARTGNPYDTTRRTDYDTTTGARTANTAPSEARRDWEDSSKVGTAAGTATGAATGAAIGSVAGPVGTVVGGIAGAVTGAGVGAAGDIAGENAADAADGTPSTRTHRNATDTTGAMTGRKGQVNVDALHAEEDGREAQRDAAGHTALTDDNGITRPLASEPIAAAAQSSSGLTGLPVNAAGVAAEAELTEEERRARRERR